jgi:hypothetical protein
MTLKRIDPISLAKTLALLEGLLGLIFGAIVALFSLFGAAVGATFEEAGPAWIGALLGVGAVIFLPILYAVIGFIAGMLIAVLYNFAAGMAGGVQLDLQ